MSILIKGMEMPKSCDDCPLNYDSIDCMVADNALRENGGGDFLFHHERHPNCPLVSIPPHGRLIDADAIPERFLEVRDLAPTIIPAEGSDMDSFIHIFEEDDEEDGMDSFIRILKD